MDELMSQFYSFMGMYAVLQSLLPPTLREWLGDFLDTLWYRLFPPEKSEEFICVEVEERNGYSYYNDLYRDVGAYLSTLDVTITSKPRFKVFQSGGQTLAYVLPFGESIESIFKGSKVTWQHICVEKEKDEEGTKKSYVLTFRKSERETVVPGYFDHITKVARETDHSNAQRYLYSNRNEGWEQVPFQHPSTFETLALEADLVEQIKADLDTFANGEEFYHKTGRAWKRGYLLYGPPGTGKSSMIAAIANHLKFDIYDLELTNIYSNAELKNLLVQTNRKSIIVIEDIDCSAQLGHRSKDPDNSEKKDSNEKLTLSGLLNFSDGLWSCCGEERIFIFTTNHKDRLDPALLRPGRMDMHILLSYCTFAAAKKMVFNYLGINDHPKLPTLRRTIERVAHEVTPATVAEVLLFNQSDPEVALEQLLETFRSSLARKESLVDAENDSGCEVQRSSNKARKRRKGLRG